MDPEPDRGTDAEASLVVLVARTGGFAGLRREWRAEPPEDDADRWIALIKQCPWTDAAAELSGDPDVDVPDVEPPPNRGADRFAWEVNARCAGEVRDALLREDDVHGPWEALIDAVRAFGAHRTAPPAVSDRTDPASPSSSA
ncbi:protealysin inhibitor emfourin [Microbacterium sp. 2FI]|uniref:protealysin inhibitor emfourin n=1 Tax=Microbacterium sp. 2FI TaxID=2502193 RepID=UPI001BB211AD|nr:protealysin inhibitor emfourin [Microbacterium sp. 2FI]